MRFTAGTLAVLLLFTHSGARPATDARPNILFLLSDDQRDDFLGCAGHPILQTPNIDRLARAGVRFENAYVTTSICAASRASILTGTWERRHGCTFGTLPLADELVDASYPALLKRAGYRTGFVGKFGVRLEDGATDWMFDSFVRLPQPYARKSADDSPRHLTDLIGDKALEFLAQCTDEQPFCLSISFNAAHAADDDLENHYPCAPAEEGLYEDAVIAPPRVSTDFWETLPEFLQNSMHRDRYCWRWDTREKYERNVRAYYRLITGLDRVTGRILEEIERLGFADETVVIFMGDNGYYKGSRGFAGKWSHYEESLRVPLIVHDPRMPETERGRVLSPLVLNVDIAPTITALAGVHSPLHQGASLLDLTDWRSDFLCEHLLENERIPKWEGVRGERHVYARYFEQAENGEFLHDLEIDPLQLRNLTEAPEYAEVLECMRARTDELRAAAEENER